MANQYLIRRRSSRSRHPNPRSCTQHGQTDRSDPPAQKLHRSSRLPTLPALIRLTAGWTRQPCPPDLHRRQSTYEPGETTAHPIRRRKVSAPRIATRPSKDPTRRPPPATGAATMSSLGECGRAAPVDSCEYQRYPASHHRRSCGHDLRSNGVMEELVLRQDISPSLWYCSSIGIRGNPITSEVLPLTWANRVRRPGITPVVDRTHRTIVTAVEEWTSSDCSGYGRPSTSRTAASAQSPRRGITRQP